MIWRTCIKQNGDSTNQNPMTYTYCLGCHDQNHVHFKEFVSQGLPHSQVPLKIWWLKVLHFLRQSNTEIFLLDCQTGRTPKFDGLIMVKPSFFGKTTTRRV